MNNNFTDSFKTPFLNSTNNIVTYVNNRFIKLTDYSKDELVGKTLNEMNNLLKINFQTDLEDIDKNCNCYLFTKKLEPVGVTISCFSLKSESENDNKKIYFFEEISNSKFGEEMSAFLSISAGNITGIAIYTIEGLLLQINNCYLNFLNVTYGEKKNCLGKRLSDINNCNINHSLENILLKVKKLVSLIIQMSINVYTQMGEKDITI